MANRLRKQATVSFQPAVPGVAATPAYCVTYSQVVKSVNGNINGGSSSAVSGGGGGGGGGGNPTPTDPNYYLSGGTTVVVNNKDFTTPSSSSAASTSSVKTKYTTVQVTSCFPAYPGQPAVPAANVVDNHTGWNAGARSSVSLDGNVTLSFYFPPAPAGVICGFSNGAPIRSYSHVQHGFLGGADGLSVIESGIVVASIPSADLTTVPALEIRRQQNVVQFLVNGSPVYTSSTPSAGVVAAEATLYSVSDYVDSPTFAAYSFASATGRIPSILAWGGDNPISQGKGFVPRPVGSVSITFTVIANGVVPAPVGVAADYDYNFGGGEMPVPYGVADVFTPDIPGVWAGGRVPPPIGSGLVIVGGIATVNSMSPAIRGWSADYDYSYGGGVWPRTGYISGAWEDFDGPDETGETDVAIVADSWYTDFPYVLVVTDGLDVSSSADLLIYFDAEFYDFVGVSSAASLSGILELMVNAGVAVNDDVNSRRRTAIQYSVNTITGALVSYEGYDFTHFARTGDKTQGQTYACRPDGLYVLDGAGDDGNPISGTVDFGQTNFADAALKHIEMAYLGIATDGQLFLRVAADGGPERVYRVVGNGEVRRASMAGKVRAHEWSVTLEVVDATFASLNLTQFEVGTTPRRFGGGSK